MILPGVTEMSSKNSILRGALGLVTFTLPLLEVLGNEMDFKALQLLNKAIILQAPKKGLPNSIFIDRQDTVSPCKLTYFKLF